MTRTVLTYIVGSLVVGALIFVARRILKPNHTYTRTTTTDVIQGILSGAGLAFITLLVVGSAYVTKVNGWTTLFGCGEPDSDILRRGACAVVFSGPINVPQEAMYWTTKVDDAGHKLSGQHNYMIHFPADGLPPNKAFWSLTMGDSQNHFVANPISRYSISDRTDLAQNVDGSVDIYIQNTAPAGHESNWLPAPPGDFILWLRVYLPGQTILDGEYEVPPVMEAK